MSVCLGGTIAGVRLPPYSEDFSVPFPVVLFSSCKAGLGLQSSEPQFGPGLNLSLAGGGVRLRALSSPPFLVFLGDHFSCCGMGF